ncbi:ABC transporter substrate-binding protein [Halobacteria archaeon AArc-dxtr1]|nr:ABC transporter substrate-binding protein [Halobacteria archaeon AArc-dxtr1]
MVWEQDRSGPALDRRDVLRGMAATGVVGAAGCLSWGDSGDVANLGAAFERATVEVDDIRRGGTLRVALNEIVSSFDPPYGVDTASVIVQNLIWESLTATDAEGNLYPWLAESYELRDTQDIDRAAYDEYMVDISHGENGVPETDAQVVVTHPETDSSADEGRYLTVDQTGDAVADGVYGMQFRYDLHEGVEFTNGEELTAEHVVRSYERYEGSHMAGQVFDQFLYAEAVDEYTVDLYAQIPDAGAERDLPVYVFPDEQVDLDPGGLDPREGVTPVGTGPYELAEFEDENYVVLTRNEDYWFDIEQTEWWDGPADWPDGPVIDEIDMSIVPDDATRSAALQDDDVDVAYGLTADARTDFQQSADYRVTATPAGGFTFLQFPVTVAPWDDARVRRAVNHLVPREQIVENIFSGWAMESWAPLPEMAAEQGSADYDALIEELREYNEYDPDRAEELLSEAGVSTPIDVTIETNSETEDRVRMVELIAEAMDQSGLFETSIVTYEWGTFLPRVMDPEYHERGRLPVIWLSGTFNPHSFVESTHHPEQFTECCNYQNVDIDELTEAMEAAQYGTDVANDDDLRAERYDEIWRLVQEHNANSYLELSVESAVVADDVRGFNAYPFPESMLRYGLYAPMDRQLTYLDGED